MAKKSYAFKKQIPVKTLNGWIMVLRCWRILAREFASSEGDEAFIGDGIDAIMADLDAQDEPRRWNHYKLIGEDGRVLRLKIEMYIEDENEAASGRGEESEE